MRRSAIVVRATSGRPQNPYCCEDQCGFRPKGRAYWLMFSTLRPKHGILAECGRLWPVFLLLECENRSSVPTSCVLPCTSKPGRNPNRMRPRIYLMLVLAAFPILVISPQIVYADGASFQGLGYLSDGYSYSLARAVFDDGMGGLSAPVRPLRGG